MIKTRVASRYARALFELAEEAGRVEPIGEELAAIAELFRADAAIRDGFTNPVTSRDVKDAALDALLESAGADKTVANFLRVLLDARKMAIVPEIAANYAAMADEAAGRMRGVAAAPTALSSEELDQLSQALSKALAKTVVLEAEQDASLVGGVVARVGNLVFDASVKTQLERLKDSLIKG